MRALLLDLDDTLLDYSGGVDASWAEACRAHCGRGGLDSAAVIRAVAESRRSFWDDPERNRRERVNMPRAWQRIVEHALACLGVSPDGLARTIAEDFAARRRATLRLFPDTLACLERLRERGVPLGLVTNGDAAQQRDKVQRFGLARFFGAIVIEGEFGAGKPDEVVYRHALDTLGAEPPDAWMVGDNLDFDVAGAQRLGVRGVWLDRPGRGLPAGSPVRPDEIIRSLSALTETG